MGTGQMIMLKGQFGRASTYQFKYSNPWMWSNRRSLTFRTWLTDGGMGSVSPLGNLNYRDERRTGLDISIGVPFSYELKSYYTFRYEGVRLKTLNKKYRDYGVAYNILYDTRDFWHNPRAGVVHSFSIEKGLGMSKDAIDYTQFDVDLKTFSEVIENQVVATRLRLGYLHTSINDDDIFGSKAYRLGGGDTVRGYDDRYPFAYGDKQFILG
jgi:outer membrane protein assembly factor BamA